MLIVQAFYLLPFLRGRSLSYIKPRLTQNRFGRESLTYEGVGENKKWMRIETYGPKLVENIVQATARDLLALAMLRLRDAGFEIVMHIHDEAVLEVPEGVSSVEEICEIMAVVPEWAVGLPLRADGYECSFYKKIRRFGLWESVITTDQVIQILPHICSSEY